MTRQVNFVEVPSIALKFFKIDTKVGATYKKLKCQNIQAFAAEFSPEIFTKCFKIIYKK